MKTTTAQQAALRFLANGGQQIKIRTARPLAAQGLIEIPANWQRQLEVAAGAGWVAATITDKGREALG